VKQVELGAKDTKISAAWQAFAKHEELSEFQVGQFAIYLKELVRWNETTNITTIASEANILAYHFQDSLAVSHFISFTGTETICDVGSGGGFPGIPLKIKYPEMRVILLEVNNKKIAFLQQVIATLGLTGIEICDYDWRTLLRKAPYDHIDYFMARASLKPDELIRLFQPGYKYNKATLVYWAAKEWHKGPVEAPYIFKQEAYKTGQKQRKLVFMCKPSK
jgi:16S rRNA (guanine527-N7)-methyltransferase